LIVDSTCGVTLKRQGWCEDSECRWGTNRKGLIIIVFECIPLLCFLQVWLMHKWWSSYDWSIFSSLKLKQDSESSCFQVECIFPWIQMDLVLNWLCYHCDVFHILSWWLGIWIYLNWVSFNLVRILWLVYENRKFNVHAWCSPHACQNVSQGDANFFKYSSKLLISYNLFLRKFYFNRESLINYYYYYYYLLL